MVDRNYIFITDAMIDRVLKTLSKVKPERKGRDMLLRIEACDIRPMYAVLRHLKAVAFYDSKNNEIQFTFHSVNLVRDEICADIASSRESNGNERVFPPNATMIVMCPVGQESFLD